MKSILIVADEPGWVFEKHALEIKKRLNEYKIDIAFRKMNIPNLSQSYDLVYVMDPIPLKHGYPPREKTVMGLRCEFLFLEHPKGAEGLYRQGFPGRCASIQDKCKAFHVVNRNQYEIFSPIVKDKPLFLAQHGVDNSIFNGKKLPKTALDEGFNGIVGTAGRSSVNKGFNLIQEACLKADYKFLTAQYGRNKISQEKMPQYYSELDIYTCMSSSEGLNNGSMEAGAMRVPLVSTKVGAASEMVRNGENGFLIERSSESLAEALNYLKDENLRVQMGNAMWEEINSNWTWDVRIEDFRTMFKEVI